MFALEAWTVTCCCQENHNHEKQKHKRETEREIKQGGTEQPETARHAHKCRLTDKQRADKQTNRQTNRQTNGQTGRPASRKTEMNLTLLYIPELTNHYCSNRHPCCRTLPPQKPNCPEPRSDPTQHHQSQMKRLGARQVSRRLRQHLLVASAWPNFTISADMMRV